MLIQPGDIGITHSKRLVPKLIQFFTRRGALGVYVAPVLATVLIVFQLYWVVVFPFVWFLASYFRLEERTWANHVRLYVTGGANPWECEVIEALSCGIMWRRLWGKTKEDIYRAANLTGTDTEKILEAAKTWVGKPYGFGALFLFMADYVLGLGIWDVFFFRKMVALRRAPVCSTAAVVWYAHVNGAGKNFGADDPRLVSPDTIHDFVREYDYYDRVAKIR